jgi:hypothetical protein
MDTSVDSTYLLISPITEPLDEDTISELSFVVPHITRKCLSKVVIIIKETPTFYLLDRLSQIAEQGSEGGAVIENDSQYCEHVAVGRGDLERQIPGRLKKWI